MYKIVSVLGLGKPPRRPYWKRVLHVALEAPQHEGGEDLVQLVDLGLLLLVRRICLQVEQVVEPARGVEETRHDEVQQRPKLLQVVLLVTRQLAYLKRRPGQKQPIFRGKMEETSLL